MSPDPLHCVQSNALFPIKQVRSLDLLDGTTESPPDVPHKSRRTLMSPKESQIDQRSPNQLEMTTNSAALASEQCPISPSYKTIGLASFLQLQRFPETPVSRLLEHQFQHRKSRKAPCTPYHLKKRADTQDSIKELGHLPTSTSRGAFLQQPVCESDPEFAASPAVDTEIP